MDDATKQDIREQFEIVAEMTSDLFDQLLPLVKVEELLFEAMIEEGVSLDEANPDE